MDILRAGHIALSRLHKLQMNIKRREVHNFPGKLDQETSQQALMRVSLIQFHMRDISGSLSCNDLHFSTGGPSSDRSRSSRSPQVGP